MVLFFSLFNMKLAIKVTGNFFSDGARSGYQQAGLPVCNRI